MKRLLLSGVTSLVALCLAEITLRLLGIPADHSHFVFQGPEFENSGSFVKDPDLFWKLRPDIEPNGANRFSLRGWAPAEWKGPRDLRIACVGDSCTLGIYVDYEETYGMQLEARLRRRFPAARIETILGGVPGYSTHQDCVLYRNKIRELHPDITVLYCGAWNDYLGAVGKNDAEFARELKMLRTSVLYKLNLARLIRAVCTHKTPDVEAFSRGEFPDGHRVPIPEFKKNVEALIDMGQENDGIVIGVIPPIPHKTTTSIRFGLDYRRALKEVYAAKKVSFVDAPSLFENIERSLPDYWKCSDKQHSVLFHDFIHPSPSGYKVIALELEKLILASSSARLRAIRQLRAQGDITITEIDPTQTPTLREQVTITIRGRGVANDSAVDRLWVGATWVREFEVKDDQTITFVLPTRLARQPGTHKVTLLTKAGSVQSPVDLEVTPIHLEAQVRRKENSLQVKVQAQAPPGLKVILWASDAVLTEPVATGVGAFWLPQGVVDSSAPEGVLPYRFELLEALPHLQGVVGDGAMWRTEQVIDLPDKLPEAYYLQGIVIWGEHYTDGVATKLIRLRVPQ